MANDVHLLDTAEAARFLGVAPGTLRLWHISIGPISPRSFAWAGW